MDVILRSVETEDVSVRTHDEVLVIDAGQLPMRDVLVPAAKRALTNSRNLRIVVRRGPGLRRNIVEEVHLRAIISDLINTMLDAADLSLTWRLDIVDEHLVPELTQGA